jgi:Alpha amylase, catalytic domain
MLQPTMTRFRRKLEAIDRELDTVTESEFQQLSTAEASSPSRVFVDQLAHDVAVHELGAQLNVAAPVTQNILPLRLKSLPKQAIRPEGSGEEIMLQGFNWESWRHSWYDTLEAQVEAIAELGISVIWLPPFTDSVAPQGYMPRDLYNLDSKYGSQEQLVRLVVLLVLPVAFFMAIV